MSDRRRLTFLVISAWTSSFFFPRLLVGIVEVPPIVGIRGSDGAIASWWSGCMFIGPADFCSLVRIINLTAWRTICSACCGRTLSSYHWHYPGKRQPIAEIPARHDEAVWRCLNFGTRSGRYQLPAVITKGVLDADTWDEATALQRLLLSH